MTIRKDTEIIQVKSCGDITLEDFKKTLDSILRIREVQGLTRVFVDTTTVTSYPSTIPVFEFGSQVADSLTGVKVAIVAVPVTRDECRFFETVARNRGGNVSVFDSPAAALAWLTE
ncbi:MAG: hypothetical protein ACYS17_06880 [Planctomycetota bacterium]